VQDLLPMHRLSTFYWIVKSVVSLY
jgi:hypothetical protein